jgi:hypothetical protein
VTDKAMDMKELAQGLSVHLRSYQKKKKKDNLCLDSYMLHKSQISRQLLSSLPLEFPPISQ